MRRFTEKFGLSSAPPGLRRLRPHCVLLLAWLLLASAMMAQSTLPGSSKDNQTYTLSGTVANSATGEPVGRAMVRINGPQSRSAFSDQDGHFEMDGLGAGRVAIYAQKPGFSSDQGLPENAPQLVDIGPASDSVVVKLLPESAIYGRVLDGNEQPIEHMQLRLLYLDLREGHKRWEPRGYADSDEDGHYRFGNLAYGTYYLAAGPQEDHSRLLASGERPKSGYPIVFYPGAPDRASAAPIQLAPGQQMEADLTMILQPSFQVSGSVSGYTPQHGAMVQFFDTSGDDIGVAVKFNSANGRFLADGVPAGNYVVKASSQSATDQQLRAETRVTVSANSENLHLALEPVISIPVNVKMESHSSSQQPANLGPPPISVRLVPEDAQNSEAYSNLLQPAPGHFSLLLQNVDPGRYEVVLNPHGSWYVASASFGQTNVLTDDLTVLPGGASSLDVVLRDDPASLSGSVKNAAGEPAQATIVALSQSAKLASRSTSNSNGGFTFTGLPPGDYLVFAFDKLTGLEYGNPDALAPYASRAAQVTLAPSQKAQVTLDLITVGDH